MPANKKYLTKSPWLRLSKISAGVVGGFTVMFSFHIFLTLLFPKDEVVATSFILGYILWAFLLLWAFVAKNVWRIWLVYLGATALFSSIYILATVW
jgi:hypothetical protein